MLRNVEQMLYTALGSAAEVQDFLKTLIAGRYDTDFNHVLSAALAAKVTAKDAPAPKAPALSDHSTAAIPKQAKTSPPAEE